MKNKYLGIVLTLIAFLFFQCHKDISYIGNPDTGVTVNPDPITATLQGNIVDENNQPAAGVSITAGTSTAITDGNGFFHINNVSLDKNTSLVTAQKDGYFKAYRVFAATSGCNQVVIKLIKRNLAGTIKSSSGGEVSLTDGSKINLPANGVVNASSGGDYSGDIKLYASYINPKASDISKTIPGSLVANDKNGKRVLLSSYGMLAVELQSSNGEKLQIKQGNVATLTIPIPSSAIASAPSSISLWYVDEQTGIWQEEGTATKKGHAYTGTVKHFSFWNCDYPIDAVNLSMTLETFDNLPLVNAEVRVTATADSARSAYGWTDSLGQVKGLVPANENLKIEVLNDCGEGFYTKNISPLTQDANLGVITITIPNPTFSLLTFTGTLIDCNGSPVKNGYAIINFIGTRYVATDTLGKFTSIYAACYASAPATVLGVDEDAQQQGQITNVAITLSGTNAGNIIACGTSSVQYINYSVDDSSFSITPISSDSLQSVYGFTTDTNYYPTPPNTTIISGQDFSGSVLKEISFSTNNTTSAGTYPLSSLGVQYYYYNTTLIQPFNITFTKFPATSGGFYEGSFSGQFKDELLITHTINASFRVRRN